MEKRNSGPWPNGSRGRLIEPQARDLVGTVTPGSEHMAERGMGSSGSKGGFRGAHVVAFYLAHGRWPTPCCRHTCDFPPCVREEHLIEGTQADNLRDAAERGRMANSRLTIEQVRAIRSDSRVQVVVAADYGISQATVSAIKTGRIRRYV